MSLCEDILSTVKSFRKLKLPSEPEPVHVCNGFCTIVRGARVGICTRGRQVRLLSDFPVHECSAETCDLVPLGTGSVCAISGKVYADVCQMIPGYRDRATAPLYDDSHYASRDYRVINPRKTDDQVKRRWMDPDNEPVARTTLKTEIEVLQDLCKDDHGKRKRIRLQENNDVPLSSPHEYFKQLEERRSIDDWAKDLEDEMMNMDIAKPDTADKDKEKASSSPTKERATMVKERGVTSMAKERASRVKQRLSIQKLVKQTRKRKPVALAPEADTAPGHTTGIFASIYKKFFESARDVITKTFVILPTKAEIDNLARAFVYLYSVIMDKHDKSERGDVACYRFSLCVLALLLICDTRPRSYLPKLPKHREGIDKSSMALVARTKQIDINNCLFFLVGRLSRCEASIRPWDECKVKPGPRLTVLRDMIKESIL
jgi:hypothetical protein